MTEDPVPAPVPVVSGRPPALGRAGSSSSSANNNNSNNNSNSNHVSASAGLSGKSNMNQYITAVGGKRKVATRDMAALHFLLNIPMKNEAQIVQTHKQQLASGMGDSDERMPSLLLFNKDGALRINAAEGEGADSVGGITPVAMGAGVEDGLGVHAPGRKLDGRTGPTVRLQSDVRFKMAKTTELSALVRQWEDTWLYSNQREGPGGIAVPDGKGKSGVSVAGVGAGPVGAGAVSAGAGAAAGGVGGAGVGKRPQGILTSRMFHSRSRGYPVCVSSIVAYAPDAERARLERNRNQDLLSLQVFKQPVRDWRGVSYRSFLRGHDHKLDLHTIASGSYESGDVDAALAASALAGADGDTSGLPSGMSQDGLAGVGSSSGHEGGAGGDAGHSNVSWHGGGSVSYLFDPDAIDDPNIAQGKHRYQLHGSDATGPVMASVILFVKADVLKASLNEQFREKHPNLPASLTLSKIRNLKKAALVGCVRAGIEVSTVATACIAFEWFCYKGIVTKANRRLCMAVVLVLAVKFAEEDIANNNEKLEAVLELADKEWSISTRQIMDAEFGAFVQLGLTMRFPEPHVALMTSRLLRLLHQSLHSYLGDAVYASYKQVLKSIEHQRYD